MPPFLVSAGPYLDVSIRRDSGFDLSRGRIRSPSTKLSVYSLSIIVGWMRLIFLCVYIYVACVCSQKYRTARLRIYTCAPTCEERSHVFVNSNDARTQYFVNVSRFTSEMISGNASIFHCDASGKIKLIPLHRDRYRSRASLFAKNS